jgi:hypothetical protein
MTPSTLQAELQGYANSWFTQEEVEKISHYIKYRKEASRCTYSILGRID